jgi:hypothetical protein
MRQGLLLGFAALAVGFGISSAADAAMCGRSCAGGGRYIPGPPSVCAANGLNWCGGRGPAVVAPPAVVIGPGGVGVRGLRVVEPRRGCRTVTVTRPDGTRITRRDC